MFMISVLRFLHPTLRKTKSAGLIKTCFESLATPGTPASKLLPTKALCLEVSSSLEPQNTYQLLTSILEKSLHSHFQPSKFDTHKCDVWKRWKSPLGNFCGLQSTAAPCDSYAPWLWLCSDGCLRTVKQPVRVRDHMQESTHSGDTRAVPWSLCFLYGVVYGTVQQWAPRRRLARFSIQALFGIWLRSNGRSYKQAIGRTI